MSSSMRAKVLLLSVTRTQYGEQLDFTAVSKSDAPYPADGRDDDNTYARFSPSASFQITVANPALFGKFNPGEKYYIDFIPAMAPDEAAPDQK